MSCDSSFRTEEQKDNKSSNRMHLALMFLSLLITHLHKSHVLMFFCLVTESSAKITNCFHFSLITHHFFCNIIYTGYMKRVLPFTMRSERECSIII